MARRGFNIMKKFTDISTGDRGRFHKAVCSAVKAAIAAHGSELSETAASQIIGGSAKRALNIYFREIPPSERTAQSGPYLKTKMGTRL